MEAHGFFLQLMIILLSARILGEVAARLKAPAVIGELLAGVILGPSLLGLLSPTETVKLLAEIGIILLLFEVGLDTDVAALVRTGAKPVIVAAGGFALPFLLGFGIGHWAFDLGLLPSLFIGGTLTATSIGITVRVLSDLKRRHGHEAQLVIGAAVLDDILGVVLLAVLYEFSTGGGVGLFNTGRGMLFIVVSLVTAPIAANVLSKIIKHFEMRTEIPGLIPTAVVSLILLSAWIAHAVGAPELLGGFAAGMALSQYFTFPYSERIGADADLTHKIEAQMKPIAHLFTPIFFVTVGLSLNLREVDWSSPFVWALSASLLAAAVTGKLAAGFLIRGESRLTRWAVGLAMIPRGEVGLIFAELGRTSGIFDHNVYAAMILVIALTTLLPPFVLRWFYAGPARNLP
jgi:Kef-type K+ transport system membrane component KefB